MCPLELNEDSILLYFPNIAVPLIHSRFKISINIFVIYCNMPVGIIVTLDMNKFGLVSHIVIMKSEK